MVFSNQELEFFARDELINIVPNFSIVNNKSIPCIGGEYGPFYPNQAVQVPLWLAIALHKREKCRILTPEWLSIDYLKDVLEKDSTMTSSFEPLPYYYQEITKILFQNASECFGENFKKTKDVIEEIRTSRLTKLREGLKPLSDANVNQQFWLDLSNVSQMELQLVRGLFLNSLDRFNKLDKVKNQNQYNTDTNNQNVVSSNENADTQNLSDSLNAPF